MLRVDEIRENVAKWYPPVKELATLKPKKKPHPDETQSDILHWVTPESCLLSVDDEKKLAQRRLTMSLFNLGPKAKQEQNMTAVQNQENELIPLDDKEITGMFESLGLAVMTLDPSLPPHFNPDQVYLNKKACALDFVYFALALKKMREQIDAKLK